MNDRLLKGTQPLTRHMPLQYYHTYTLKLVTSWLSLTSHHSSQPQVHIIDDRTFKNTFQCLHYRSTLHAKILNYYLQGIHQYLPIQILTSNFSFVKCTLWKQSRCSYNTKNGMLIIVATCMSITGCNNNVDTISNSLILLACHTQSK